MSSAPESRPGELDRHAAATRSIRAMAADADRVLVHGSGELQVRSLRALTDQMVMTLVPLLEAEEIVVCPILDARLRDWLREDQNTLRGLAERLSILSDNAEASRRRAPHGKPLARALRATITALDSLEGHQREASLLLADTLNVAERDELDVLLRAASAAARDRTLMVVQPPIPSTTSTVFRRRPDLDSAHVISVAEIDQGSGRSN